MKHLNFHSTDAVRSRFAKFLAVFFAVFGVLLSLSSVPPCFAQVTLRPELTELEKSLETKLISGIQMILGPDLKIVASVRVLEAPTRTPAAAPAIKADPTLSDEYLPLSIPQEPTAAASGKSSIQIASVEADIQVPSDTSDERVKSIQRIGERLLKSYSGTVTIGKFDASARTPASAPNGSEDKTKDSTPKPADKNLFYMLAAVCAAALIICIGIIFVSRALKFIGKELADGVRSIKFPTAEAKSGPTEVNVKASEAALKEPKKPPTPSNATKDYTRNIKLLQQVLQDKPMLFVQALSDEDLEYAGIKWVLPALAESEQETVRKYLGQDRLTRLTAMEPEKSRSFEGTNWVEWLQGFVERMMIKKVQGGSAVHRAMGAERVLELYLCNRQHLILASTSINTRAGWRIAAEFLSRDQFEKVIASMDQEKWRVLLGAGECKPEELESTAGQLTAEITQLSSQQGSTDLSKLKFMSDSLLGPTIGMLLGKALGEDDAFLDQLQQESPEFVQLIREKVWTPRMLDAVPDPELARMIKPLDTQQKIALLVGLPKAQAEKIVALMPEGNAKTIAVDRSKKIQDQNDLNELKKHAATAREFLDYLRTQEKAGKLKIDRERLGGSVSQAAAA